MEDDLKILAKSFVIVNKRGYYNFIFIGDRNLDNFVTERLYNFYMIWKSDIKTVVLVVDAKKIAMFPKGFVFLWGRNGKMVFHHEKCKPTPNVPYCSMGPRLLIKAEEKGGHFLYLLVKEKRRELWTIPGGYSNGDDKTLFHGALREVNEETGLNITMDDLRDDIQLVYLKEYYARHALMEPQNNMVIYTAVLKNSFSSPKFIKDLDFREITNAMFASKEEALKLGNPEVKMVVSRKTPGLKYNPVKRITY